jgi:DMSO/TMAO reductase YedYZ heme-binding membrane subunit
MAANLKPQMGERASSAAGLLGAGLLACGLALGAGYVAAWGIVPTLHSREFLWVTARALGIAGYLSLTALVAVGIWMKHPWRSSAAWVHAETRLRAHAALAVATVALVFGHVASIVADRYAGVGWLGAIVPGLSHYRALAVGLGVVAFQLMLLMAATAGFAGRRGTRHWLGAHRLALFSFAATCAHGSLAGTDTSALRLMYVSSGLLVALLAVTRALGARAGRHDTVEVSR